MENRPVTNGNKFEEAKPVPQETDGCRKRIPDKKKENKLEDVTETSLVDNKAGDVITKSDLPKKQDDKKPESNEYLPRDKNPETDKPIDITKDNDNPTKQYISNVFIPTHSGFWLILIIYFVPYLSIMVITHALYANMSYIIVINLVVMLLVYSILTVMSCHCPGFYSLLVHLLVFLSFGSLYYIAMDYRLSDYILLLGLIYGCIITKRHIRTAIWFCFNSCLLGGIVIISGGEMMAYNELMFIACVVLFIGNLCRRPYTGKVQMMGMAVCRLVVVNVVVYCFGLRTLELMLINFIGINTILGFLLSFEVIRQDVHQDQSDQDSPVKKTN